MCDDHLPVITMIGFTCQYSSTYLFCCMCATDSTVSLFSFQEQSETGECFEKYLFCKLDSRFASSMVNRAQNCEQLVAMGD